MAIKVLLVDDHPLFRKGIRLLLEEQKDICIVGEAEDGQEAIDRVRALVPDVVIIDITMPDMNGIEATRRIVSEIPSAKVVALSIHSKKRFVEGMLAAGAAGYILKKSVPEDLVNGIRTVHRGETYLSPTISGIVVSQYVKLLDKSLRTAQEENDTTILSTKLHLPQLDRNHIHRLHLLERLDQARERVCTLVSAPAGYGKTSLISSWIEKYDGLCAWVSLDEKDNDLRMFLNYFLSAIQTLFPDAVRKTLAMANSSQLPPLSSVTGTLINELDRIEQPFILSLDDCHLIRNESVFDLIADLMKNPPQFMHLILISRRDLPLPIHSLRTKGRVTEIRTQELRFSLEETTTFLNKTLGVPVDPAIVRAVRKKTEGWVTGLRLATLTLKLDGDIDPRLLDPMVDAQYVMEYLFIEVFSQQPPEFNRYFLGTSILDRFCAPLCEAVCLPGENPLTCEAGGWKFLNWLNKENIFVISLDVKNRWFRYHPIFRKFLENQLKRHLNTDEIKTLHSQASEWFFDNKLIEEGLQHSLAADNIARAVQMVIKHGHDLMNNQQWLHLERWIGMLPRDTIEQEPELIMFKAWHNHVHKAGHDLPAMKTYLEKVKMLVDKLPQKDSLRAAQLKGHFDALRGFQSLIFGDAKKGQKYVQSACKNIPMNHKRARVFACIFQAGAYQMTGDLEAGLSVYSDEMLKSSEVDSAEHATYLVYLCFIFWLEADLFTMRKTAEGSLKISMKYQIPEATAYGHYFAGIACYLQNDLKTAEEQLSTMFNDYFFINTVMSAHGAATLALVYLAKGEIGRAQKLYEQVMDYAIGTNNKEAYFIGQAFEAEYALRQGNLKKASNWANQFNSKPFLLPFLFFLPHLTQAKILLAQNTKDSRQQAADLLEQLSNFLTSIHNKSSQISVLAIQALLLDSQGEKSGAHEKLTEALNLAEPGGFIRVFLDLGPQMVKLLRELVHQNIAVNYIGRILTATKEDEKRAMHNKYDYPAAHPPPFSTQPLVDPLTNRELDVLDLLAQRRRNKEIAANLFISPETVKKHLKNIYG
ncbi:MAG: response regulator, partial [Desulfobacterales bacterium]